LAFLAILAITLTLLRYIRIILLIPDVWFVIAMATFCICTGGVVYSIIHNVPWFKFERDEFGKVFVSEYFMRGQRGQWAGEGYIVSVLVAITGIILIFLSRVNKIFTKSFHKRVAILAGVVAVWILTQLILVCYQFKSPWYGPTFFPPGHYQRGPLMADQGNNI
jgi:hypothetical protein